jgi:tRNA(Ile)-lysidine synthase
VPPVNGPIIRPLFYCSRALISQFLESSQIPWRTDSSNKSSDYHRNHIRAEILPQWRTENPAIDAGLARLGEQLWRQRRYLEEQAALVLDSVICETDDRRLLLAADGAGHYDDCLDPFVMRLLIERLGLEIVPQSSTVAQFTRLRTGRGDTVQRVEQGDLIITRSKNRIAVTIRDAEAEAPTANRSVGLLLADAASANFGPLRVETSVIAPPTPGAHDDSAEAFFDLAAVKGDLKLRYGRTGERYRPLGLGGSKKLVDLLADRGVPSFARREVPILGDAKGILWPVGHPIDERARITATTMRALHVRVVKQ